MGYNRKQIAEIFNTRMRSLTTRIARDQQDRDTVAYNEYIERQETMAKANLALSALTAVSKVSDRKLGRILSQTFPGEAGKFGDPKKFELKEPMNFEEFKANIGTGKNVMEGLKRLLPSGKVQETEEYTEFKAVKAEEELERARKTVPLAEEDEFLTGDEDIIETPDDLTLPHTRPEDISTEDLKRIQEDAKKAFEEEQRGYQGAYEELAGGPIPEGFDDAYDADLQLEDLISDKDFARSLIDDAADTGVPELKMQTGGEDASAIKQFIEETGLEYTPEEFKKWQDYELPSDLEPEWYEQDPEEVEIPDAKIPETDIDPITGMSMSELEAMQDKPLSVSKTRTEQMIELNKTPERQKMIEDIRAKYETDPETGMTLIGSKTKKADIVPDAKQIPALRGRRMTGDPMSDEFGIVPKDMPDIMKKSPQYLGPEDAPLEKVEILDVKPGILTTGGKIVSGAQDVAGALGQIKTLTGEGTDEEKAIAGTQLTSTGLKEIGEKVTEKTVEKVGEEAGKKGLGKALGAVGKGLGAGVGIYTGLKTALAKDAGEHEKWGGGLQAFGSALIGTGIGAPIGGVLAAGGTLLSMFGGKKKSRAPAPKRRIDLSRYYQRGRG